MVRSASLIFLLVVASFVSLGTGAQANGSTKTESNEKHSAYSYCGRNPAPSRSRVRRVIGGKEADEYAWPWQVLILNASALQCGGAIISPTFLITAAHCVDKMDEMILNIYVGRHRVNKTDPHEQKLSVRQVFIHPKYSPGNLTDPGDYDMALIELSAPIKFTKHVQAICVPDVDTFKPGHNCILSGWGYTNMVNKTTSDVLQQVKLPLVSRKVCNSNKSYGGIIHQRFLCAGFPEGGKDGCTYDSGGPLMCAQGKNDPWYLVGLMVWGEGCANKNKYGVYSNVAKFMDIFLERVKDLPKPYTATSCPSTVESSSNDSEDKQQEKLFIAIICALCVIIVILLTTLCIVNFYTRGYICCTSTQSKYQNEPTRILHEQNGKLNGEVSV